MENVRYYLACLLTYLLACFFMQVHRMSRSGAEPILLQKLWSVWRRRCSGESCYSGC